MTERLALERASFGSDRISAEVEPPCSSQRAQGFDVADLIGGEIENSQASQRA